MTKKTSLLLTALFAVSGMATCHAEHKFFDQLVPWGERKELLNKYGKEIHNAHAGSDWDSTTKEDFNNYKAKINAFRKNIDSFNTSVSAVTSEPVNLPKDGTDLVHIGDTANNIKLQVLSGQSVEDVKKNTAEIKQIIQNLVNKINEAKKLGIDVSSNNSANKPAPSPSTPSHSSGRSHGSRARY
jgi:hypothetical protein